MLESSQWTLSRDSAPWGMARSPLRSLIISVHLQGSVGRRLRGRTGPTGFGKHSPLPHAAPHRERPRTVGSLGLACAARARRGQEGEEGANESPTESGGRERKAG